jgi:hypothetical protein
MQELSRIIAPLACDKYIPTEKKLLATLWILATPESYRSVADRFAMSKGTLHSVVKETTSAIASLCTTMIQFKTSTADMITVAKGFQDKTGFPGVIGAIDGTHIEITGPSENRSSYVNRKGYYTII